MIRLGVDAINLAADRRGMGRLVRQTLRSLQATGDVELVLVVRNASEAAPLWREFNYPTISTGDLGKERLDAVWYPWNGMRFAPHARSIVTIHDPFAFTYPHSNFVARWREQSPVRRAIKSADDIFAPSSWTAEELQRLFRISETRVRVVPNAPDEFWYPVAVPQREPYTLFVAGPEERKNAQMLFRVYDAAFQGSGPELVVVGTLDAAGEQAFERVRGPRRHELPSDKELREMYSGALLVLVPSLAEGYGLPAVEAMACGAPVIASNATALPETCDGAAVLVRATDENAWRSTIRTVYFDGALRRDLRTRGLARVARLDRHGPAKALLACIQQF